MIAWLRGVVVAKGIDTVVLDVGGVGYELHVSLRALQKLPPVGDAATVHVHTHVREDAIQLFGFTDLGAKRLFTELIGVSGIGPKLALNALSVYPADELREMILAGDLARLTRISGVGKKTAQRVVLELGEKLRGVDIGGGADAPRSGVLGDLRGALADLGYPPKKADAIIDALGPRAADGATIEELLKEALALLRS